jgi:hypothetical protein
VCVCGGGGLRKWDERAVEAKRERRQDVQSCTCMRSGREGRTLTRTGRLAEQGTPFRSVNLSDATLPLKPAVACHARAGGKCEGKRRSDAVPCRAVPSYKHRVAMPAS